MLHLKLKHMNFMLSEVPTSVIRVDPREQNPYKSDGAALSSSLTNISLVILTRSLPP